ncbi:MAG: uracil-DNA glycosylase family protein [Prevotella sp.]|nr:uracil-DNA glycosylase family protein [Prevotella sp.]
MVATIERHPLTPFLPKVTRLLMLGSFPPARRRWCMEFFYPNFTNDMWRIFGICFFGDKLHFVDEQGKAFRKEALERFLTVAGIGLYDTAVSVRRLKNTASDKDLEIVEETDIKALLRGLPECGAIVTTGQKATDVVCRQFGAVAPTVGAYADVTFGGRNLRLYRMPSSSRAYPMRLEQKAAFYKEMFDREVSEILKLKR